MYQDSILQQRQTQIDSEMTPKIKRPYDITSTYKIQSKKRGNPEL